VPLGLAHGSAVAAVGIVALVVAARVEATVAAGAWLAALGAWNCRDDVPSGAAPGAPAHDVTPGGAARLREHVTVVRDTPRVVTSPGTPGLDAAPPLAATPRTVADTRTGRAGRPTVALAIGIVAWTLACTGLVLLAVNRPRWDADLTYFLVDATDALVYGGIAALVLAREAGMGRDAPFE
jgi:hypothetical protein